MSSSRGLDVKLRRHQRCQSKHGFRSRGDNYTQVREGGRKARGATGPPTPRLPAATPNISLEWRGGSHKVTGMTLKPLGTSQPPLNECSESQSAWRNSPWPWTPAPWHRLTYIFTQLLFLRTETKKKKKLQSPTAQQSCMEGLEGLQAWLPGGKLGGARGPPTEQGSLSPASPSETLLIFPDSGEAGWASNVFPSKKGGSLQPLNDRK